MSYQEERQSGAREAYARRLKEEEERRQRAEEHRRRMEEQKRQREEAARRAEEQRRQAQQRAEEHRRQMEEQKRQREQQASQAGTAQTSAPVFPKGMSGSAKFAGLPLTFKPTVPTAPDTQKSGNTFYTSAPDSGIMSPKPESIAGYQSAIEKQRKTLKALHKQQYNLMLQNDVAGMNALDVPIRTTETYLNALKERMGGVMGANIHGKPGNQLLDNDDEQHAPYGAPVNDWRSGNGRPQFAANDTPAHVTGLDGTEAKGVTYSGGGYADFFKEQREEDAQLPYKKDPFQGRHAYDDKGFAGGGFGGGGAGGSWGDEDTGYDYISEKDYDAQMKDLESQLEIREKLTEGYSTQLGASAYSDPNYKLYQDGYSRNLDEAVTLREQIKELNDQREWSQKADDIGGRSYDTEEEAAVAFADPAVIGTGNDNLERGAVIIHKQVPIVDQNGNIVLQSKYVLKDTFVGDHDNVISGVLSSYLESIGDLAQGDTISFVHTHPNCTGHVPNKFSGEKGETAWDIMDYAIDEVMSKGNFNEFAEYLGDQQVAWLPGVERMYLASPTLGELYAVDKNGPVLDSSTQTGYKVFGIFNSVITGQPYQD